MQGLTTPGAIPVVMSPGRVTQYEGLSYDPNTGILTSRSLEIQKGGVSVGTRGVLNFIEGSNITITATDDPVNSRTDVTVAATGGGGSGTVTSVSVTTANGVSGSVATATTTPAISLTLGAITPSSVAAVGTVTGSNLSGTNTGDQTSISGNAGTATALATPRAIYGNNFDGSAALTQVISSAYGGTGNGFTKFSGPTTAEKTFTLPDATATILTSDAVVTVAQGGTGTGSTLTGLVRGSGSAMTAAELSGDVTTSGSNAATVTRVNGVSLAGLATGILKNTTATGVPSIATAGTDYVIPSGSVATLTTPRNINGVAFNGSADITVTAAAGTLSGGTLAAGVTASSLTSFGSSPTISGFTNANHTHADAAGGGTLNASAIAAGTMATARLGSGTANATTFLRGDQTWAVPGGGSDPWTYVVLGSDFPTTSGTAVNVTGMEFTPASSTKYEIEVTLFTRTATATVGVRPGVGWPTAGVTDGVAFIQQTSAAGTNVLQNGNFNAAVLAPVGGNPNTTQSWPGFIRSSLIMTTGATGTWRVQVASETAGTTVTIKAGSYLKYRTYA